MPVLAIGAALGFLAVALGAFGAHGLEGKLTAEGKGWWETATLYALTHSVILGALGLAKTNGLTRLDGPAIAFAMGILIFSGTLYAMSLGAPRWFGAITPIGGVALLVGWGWLCFRGFQG